MYGGVKNEDWGGKSQDEEGTNGVEGRCIEVEHAEKTRERMHQRLHRMMERSVTRRQPPETHGRYTSPMPAMMLQERPC